VKDGWTAFRGLKDWIKGLFDDGGSLRVGAKVFHPSYGEGIIETIQGSGASARVCVDFGFAKPIVSLSELTIDSSLKEPQPVEGSNVEPQPIQTPTSALNQTKDPSVPRQSSESEPKEKPVSTKQMTEREVEARKGIMALRLGQVLESQITDLSVGTAELEKTFNNAISNTMTAGPTFLLVDAVWGAGKTHALTLLQVLARKTMFATSYVVMDGISTSLARPMELMTELMSGLRFPDKTRPTDLSHQLAKAKQDERVEILENRGAKYLSDTLRALPLEAFDDPDVLDLLSDFIALRISATDANNRLRAINYRANLKSVKAHRVVDRAPRFAELLKEWAIFSSVIGYKGLLVVLDELDVEYAAPAYWSRSFLETIEHRRELLGELGSLQKTPLMIAFGAAPGDPSLDEAFDPVRDVIGCLKNKVQHIKVAAPNEKNLRLLLGRLLELYGDAYSVETAHLNQGTADNLLLEIFEHYRRDPNGITRRFVRSAIERMDLLLGQSADRNAHPSPRL
jgi:hypothetical protein